MVSGPNIYRQNIINKNIFGQNIFRIQYAQAKCTCIASMQKYYKRCASYVFDIFLCQLINNKHIFLFHITM